jgi:hypothetical protein
MTSLTTKPIPGFFGQYCAVIPKADPGNFIAVGITPGQECHHWLAERKAVCCSLFHRMKGLNFAAQCHTIPHTTSIV